MIKEDPNGTIFGYKDQYGHVWDKIGSDEGLIKLTLIQESNGNPGTGVPFYVTPSYFEEYFAHHRYSEVEHDQDNLQG